MTPAPFPKPSWWAFMVTLHLLVFAPLALFHRAGDAQVPDNTRIELDPADDLDPAYRDTLSDRDRERLDDALSSGETFLPVITGPGEVPPAPPAEPEPLQYGIPGLAGETAPPEAAAPIIRQPAAVAPAEPVYEDSTTPALTEQQSAAILDQLQTLLEAWTRPPEVVAVTYPEAEAREDGTGSPSDGPGRTAAPGLGIGAGQALYARALYTISSDYPGPALLEILEPPLAGAVVSGAFTQVRDRLVLRLSSIEHEGRRTPIDGWAVDLDCACYGIEGSVDRHWFERVLLPAAFRFAGGWLDAASTPDTTVTVNGDVVVTESADPTSREQVYRGIAAATGTVEQVLREDAPARATVTIPRNTELAVVLAEAASPADALAPETADAGQ